MKSRIKNLSLATLLFLTNYSFAATGEPLFRIEVTAAKTINFDTKDMAASTVEVTFADASGTVLFNEYTPAPQTFERAYNLESLEDAIYFLLIKTDRETQKLIVTIKNDKLEVNMKNPEQL